MLPGLDRSESRRYIRYLSLGMEIAVSLALPILAGFWLDRKLESSPWFLLVGILTGLVLLLGMFIRLIRNDQE